MRTRCAHRSLVTRLTGPGAPHIIGLIAIWAYSNAHDVVYPIVSFARQAGSEESSTPISDSDQSRTVTGKRVVVDSVLADDSPRSKATLLGSDSRY